jgi:hypothetical protein
MCHLCGWGAVGPLGLVSRAYGIPLEESLRVVSSVGAFLGPDQLLSSQSSVEGVQSRVVALYRGLFESGSWTSGSLCGPLPGEEFLGRVCCESSALADALGPEASKGFVEARGSKTRLQFRILWSLSGAPSEVVVETLGGVETRRFLLDRQPVSSRVSLSVNPSSLFRPWTGKSLVFMSEKSAVRLWRWVAPYCASAGVPAIAVSSAKGLPEQTGRFGQVDVLVVGREPSVNAVVFEGGASSDVRVVRVVDGIDKTSESRDVIRMEAGGTWRTDLHRPLDDMASLVSLLCMDGMESFAEDAASAVMSSGLVPSRHKWEFLCKISSSGADSGTSAIAEAAMATTIQGQGFILLPTPSGYLARNTGACASPDLMATDYRVVPACWVRTGDSSIRIAKIISSDGSSFFCVSPPPMVRSGGRRFAESVRRAASEAGSSATTMCLKAADAIHASLSMGGMPGDVEIADAPGFRSGELRTPSSIALASGGPPVRGLVEWISRETMMGPPGDGWREALSRLVEEDLSCGFSESGGAGPAMLLAIAMEFLLCCSESVSGVSVVLPSRKCLDAFSSVSGIGMVPRGALTSPFDLSRVPVCLSSPERGAREGFMFHVSGPGLGPLVGPRTVDIGDPEGFDFRIPVPDLHEIYEAASEGRDVASAIASVALVPRSLFPKCRDIAQAAASSFSGGVPGFVSAFLEFIASPSVDPFVVAVEGDLTFVEVSSVRSACAEAGISSPTVRRAVGTLRASGVCRGTAQKGPSRLRCFVVDSSRLNPGSNLVEARFA